MGYLAGEYDVIVIGAGHAGCEAALAAARMGCETLLLTINLDMIAFMPCNPSVGGPAKGHVVREIDALGGEMGRNIDKTFIQMRMLNTGKGPAVHALRAQADKFLYQHTMKETIEKEETLTLRQGMAEDLIVEDGICRGVVTKTGAEYRAKTVVLTTGTYLRGKVIMGELMYESGPNNQQPAVKLSESLRNLGIQLVRFKTGTPPRVHQDTIDFSKTEIQPGDEKPKYFSFETEYMERSNEQLPCWLTYTSEDTHRIINDNLHRAPMFSGAIEGTGPRYCPSIEDKIVRFADKPKHQIFLEPEGRNTKEYYVQGLSTSMPEDVQLQILRSIPGLEKVEMMRTGYAIEYDAVVPTQLWPSLEMKLVPNLFTAGQINGTSGYEEAAGQGIMAGINAARKAKGEEPVIIDRSAGYIGVMIDDLVTKGTNEPYRLLTSRAEYRLLLRHDNADLRLTPIGREIGLITEARYEKFLEKKALVEGELVRLKETKFRPDEEVQAMLAGLDSAPIQNTTDGLTLLRRPEVTYADLERLSPSPVELTEDMKEQVEIQTKYTGYIEKQLLQVERLSKMEKKKIPDDIDYSVIHGLATEARQKLDKIRPLSIGQASRISGVTPADLSILLVHLEHYNRVTAARELLMNDPANWLQQQAGQMGIVLSEEQLSQFERYYELLVEWNEKMNLTGITERGAVYEKHFYDSLTVASAVELSAEGTKLADIGSGAGFPSIPLKIAFPTLKITIVDSLAKRIRFLEEVVKQLGLRNVDCVHGRAEDIARLAEHRDRYDVVTARAVARLAGLNELCLPFAKTGGAFVSMKGSDIQEELSESRFSLDKLGAKLTEVKRLELPLEQSERHLVVIAKIGATPKIYPRKAGMPLKSPLVSSSSSGASHGVRL